jgi:4-carboxymuconolactone decarboxylase
MADAGPSRILEIPEDKLTPEQKAGIEAVIGGRGRLLTPYKVWIHSPALMRAFETLGTFLNKKSSLSEREVELSIVLAAHHWHGEFVQTAHVKRLRELGVAEPVLDALKRGAVPDLSDARERVIYDLFKLTEAPGGGSDEVFERATKLLGRNGLAEAIALFGYYSAVAIAMKLHRVPIPA